MVHHAHIVRLLIFMLIAATTVAARADGVLDRMPHDARAFVYLRNWKSFDNKLAGIMAPLVGRNPIVVTPGVIIQVIVGKDVGLDPEGELLLAAVGDDRTLDRSQLFVWLPVADYGKFTHALGGKPNEEITVVTISGEDVLCARQDRWAVIADPAQRQRLQALLAGKPEPPPRLAAMRQWLGEQEMAAGAFPNEALRKAFRDWLAAGVVNQPAAQPTLDDLFAPQRVQNQPVRDVFGLIAALRNELKKNLDRSPKLGGLAHSADGLALGVRIDDSLNVTAGLKMSWPKDRPPGEAITKIAANVIPPALHREGAFIASGGGALPRPLAVATMEAYFGHLTEELRRDSSRSKFDDESIVKLKQACEQAAGEVISASVCWPMGGERDGVSTNQYLAIRTSSAEKFVARTAEIMRRWNEVNGGAQPSTGMVYESQQVQVAGRAATQYSLDVAASVGGEDTTEMKMVMEKMFGPDRKLHLMVVAVDDQTVIVVQGTPQQAERAAGWLTDKSRTADWNVNNVIATNKLLPLAADLRWFLSPRGYAQQHEREIEAAGMGIGHVAVQMAESPPIGLAAGFDDGALWLDVVAPIEAIKAIHRAQNPRPQ